MNDPEDMRYWWTPDEDVRLFVAAHPDLKDVELNAQVSRLRRAWHAYRRLADKRDDGRATNTTMDLDDPLEEETLRGGTSGNATR